MIRLKFYTIPPPILSPGWVEGKQKVDARWDKGVCKGSKKDYVIHEQLLMFFILCIEVEYKMKWIASE